MELTNEFRVALPVEAAWAVLTDLERIAPCMPGAQLQEVEGDDYRGVVKVKVGPITAQYKGVASFVSQDEEAHVAVLRAEGRETRGQGNANATITATLVPVDGGTQVDIGTDLQVTGRVAQFGRGVLADVSAKLLGQFVACLEETVLVEPEPQAAEPATSGPITGDDADPVAASSPAAASAVRTIDSPEPAPVDLLGTAGTPVAKRVGPVLGVVAIVWLLKKLLSRR